MPVRFLKRNNKKTKEKEKMVKKIFYHTREGADNGHSDVIANYKTWDESNWTLSINPNGRFLHRKNGGDAGHTDDIVNYITWDGSKWTARIIEGDRFLHTRQGASSGHEDIILNYKTWDGSNWTLGFDDGVKKQVANNNIEKKEIPQSKPMNENEYQIGRILILLIILFILCLFSMLLIIIALLIFNIILMTKLQLNNNSS